MSTKRIAFKVAIFNEPCIVFAETAAKAKFIAVRSYWEAYGKSEGWPEISCKRIPGFDSNPLCEGERAAWTIEHAEAYQEGGK